MYSKKIDLVSKYLVYRGEALVGSSEEAPVWRIRRILIDVKGVETTEFVYNSVWKNRYSLPYGDTQCPRL